MRMLNLVSDLPWPVERIGISRLLSLFRILDLSVDSNDDDRVGKAFDPPREIQLFGGFGQSDVHRVENGRQVVLNGLAVEGALPDSAFPALCNYERVFHVYFCSRVGHVYREHICLSRACGLYLLRKRFFFFSFFFL